ncbi:MAG: PTS sugar transporter subunit IIA [Bacillota bacterium]
MALFGRKKKEENAIITLDDIRVGEKSVDKFEAIRMAGRMLVAKGCVDENYIEGMVEREKIMTTYMGEGVAIPHGVGELKKFVKKTGIVVLQFPDGVDFDGETAHLVVGIAGAGEDHIPILQGIATVMMDEDIIADFVKSQDKKYIMKQLTDNVEL